MENRVSRKPASLSHMFGRGGSRPRRFASALAAVLIAGTIGAPASAWAVDPTPAPFDSPDGAAGASSAVGADQGDYLAAAYREADRYVYAIRSSDRHLLRIGLASGGDVVAQDLQAVTNADPAVDFAQDDAVDPAPGGAEVGVFGGTDGNTMFVRTGSLTGPGYLWALDFGACDSADGAFADAGCVVASRLMEVAAMTEDATAEAVVGLGVVASVSPGTATQAGDRATYSFAVTNPGPAAVSGLVIGEQSFSGTGALAQPSCELTELAPGATTTCETGYTVTLADVAARSVSYVAVARAQTPDGVQVTGPASAVTLAVTPVVDPATDLSPVLELTNTVNKTIVTAVGERVVYTYTIRNTGDTDVTGVTLRLQFSGGGEPALASCSVDGSSGTTPQVADLAVGQVEVCTTVGYAVTEADGQAGIVTNVAYVEATFAGGIVRSDPSTATTIVALAPDLATDTDEDDDSLPPVTGATGVSGSGGAVGTGGSAVSGAAPVGAAILAAVAAALAGARIVAGAGRRA